MDEPAPRPHSTPVVVVGGTLNSLGVVRSLAGAGIPIHVLATSRACAAGWSRHTHFVSAPSLEGPALVQSLVNLALHLRSRPVLVLTADESVETVSQERERIASLYRFSLPGHEFVQILSDKILFQEFAQREGFPVPRAVALGGVEDLTRLGALTPPLVLKPASKLLVLKGLAARAVRAETLEKAKAAATALLQSAPQVLAQEWIEGADDSLFFTLFSCDRNGRLLGLFTGRKLICSPAAIGSTAVCVPAPEVSEVLADQTRRFISRTQYRGLGSLEFKREQSTGRYLIVEPTVGRTDLQEEIATLCGSNLPLLTYRAEVDEASAGDLPQTPPASASTKEFAWRSSIEYRRALKTAGISSVDGFFRWSDPMPALYYYGYERGALRVWRRCRRLLSTPRSLPPPASREQQIAERAIR